MLDWLAEIVKAIALLPGAIWAVVGALGGVMYSNRASDKRLRAQFEYERTLRNNDRELALRKDIFLAATEAISAGFHLVSSIPNLDIPLRELSADYLKKAPAIMKINIVGNIKSIKAIMNVSNEINNSFLKLTLKRGLLDTKKNKIVMLNQNAEEFDKERGRMLELMKQYNLEGSTDKNLWDTIKGNIDLEQKRSVSAWADVLKLGETLVDDQLQLGKSSIEELFNLVELFTPCMIAMREELQLPVDEKDFEQIMKSANTGQMELLEEFYDRVRSLIDEDVSPAADNSGEVP